ncbi:hypothetical protein [uncultured Polaribacter sp.]|uniref:hypothetical protein n=1 Tax=uncultured Polaribacter sp. TaxID=174711 RepID=UPI002635EC47|nr:hypothetical protein [uncultured Polaribacter sp.]
MENKQHINNQVDDTFNVLDKIEKVKVNHFFKHKVLQKINTDIEVVKPIKFSWFTPNFQLATLSIVLLLNIGAIFYAFSITENTSTSDLDIFAQEYSLRSKNDSLLK